MRKEQYSASVIRELIEEKKVCTLEEVMARLGTKVRMTVLRKLAELPYQTSYSHRGKYYTLKPLCQFDRQGLWSWRKAWFSVYGTLRETGRNLIGESDAGYSNSELNELLHVQTKQALLLLYRERYVTREKFDGVYVYFSSDKRKCQRQIITRCDTRSAERGAFDGEVLAHELKAAIILFFGLLDERQRRIFAGLESMKIGQGGDAKVAGALAIDPHTVAKGRKELQERDIEIDRVRRKGAGRPAQEKKRRK